MFDVCRLNNLIGNDLNIKKGIVRPSEYIVETHRDSPETRKKLGDEWNHRRLVQHICSARAIGEWCKHHK